MLLAFAAIPTVADDPLDPALEATNATLLQLAEALYGVGSYKIYTAPEADVFAAAFPEHDVYRVANLSQHPVPVHAMAVKDGDAWDVTRHINNIHDGSLILTSADALALAEAIGTFANLEQDAQREVVNSSDSSRLGITVPDPEVTQLIDGWRVKLYTWSHTNGRYAVWYVTTGLDSIKKVSWEVRELNIGNHAKNLKQTTLLPNTQLINSYDVAHTLTAKRWDGQTWETLLLPHELDSLTWTALDQGSNDDGTTWIVYATTNDDATLRLSENLTAAGAWAHGWLTESTPECSSTTNPDANWGYTNRDPDCDLAIRILPTNTLHCGACTDSGNSTSIDVHSDVYSYITQDLEWYRDATHYDLQDVVRLALGQTYFVSLSSPTPEMLPDVHPAPTPGDFFRNDATVDPEHFAVRAIFDPAFRALWENLSQESGFEGLAPNLTGSTELTARFSGAAPSDLHEDLLPTSWSLQVLENYSTVSAITTFSADNVEESILPVEEWEKIGPGSMLIVSLRGETFSRLCTANFVWSDGTDYYLGTAGHCVFPEDEDALHLQPHKWSTIEGKSGYEYYPLSNITATVCVENCSRGSFTDPHFPSSVCALEDTAKEQTICIYEKMRPKILGDIVYGRVDMQDSDEDFALFKIKSDFLTADRVDPSIPVWTGPDAVGCPAPMGEVYIPRFQVFYGNGAVIGETQVTKSRGGFYWGDCFAPTASIGSVAHGDSGTGIAFATPDPFGTLGGTYAGSILSQADLNNGIIGATDVANAQQMILEDLSLSIDIVCEGWTTCS